MDEDPCGYGSIIILNEGIVVQSLGEHVNEYCLVMPKYVFCNDPETPWRRGSIKLCRIIRGYGPLGLQRAIRKSGVKEVYSPIHGTWVPVSHVNGAHIIMTPRYAVLEAVRRGLYPVSEIIYYVLRKTGLSLKDIGLTGSYAGGYNHDRSDVDIVAYGIRAASELYNLFLKLSTGAGNRVTKEELGGITVNLPVDISWRRVFLPFNGRRLGVTWIGAPMSNECDRLLRRRSPPDRIIRDKVIYIPPRQECALLYPPSVEIEGEGILVSYEYNLGSILYNGGKFRISALSSSSGRSIYIGLREFPGKIEVLD